MFLIMLAVCTMMTLALVIHITVTPRQVMISLRSNIFTTRTIDPKIIYFGLNFMVLKDGISMLEKKSVAHTLAPSPMTSPSMKTQVLSCSTIEVAIG